MRSISLYSPGWPPNHHNFSASDTQNFVLSVFLILWHSPLTRHTSKKLATVLSRLPLKNSQVTVRVMYFTTRLVLMSNRCPSFGRRPRSFPVLVSGSKTGNTEHLNVQRSQTNTQSSVLLGWATKCSPCILLPRCLWANYKFKIQLHMWLEKWFSS